MIARRKFPRRKAAGLAFAASIVAGLLVDGWLDGMPLVPLPSRFPVPDVENALVIELPFDDPEIAVAAMYRAIDHGRPLVNGYSGHFPPHYHLLARALRRRDPTALRYFAIGRPLIVLVHRARDRDGQWAAFVQSAGGIPQDASGLGPIFVVPPQPRENPPPLGAALPSTPTPAPAGYAAVDLGTARTIRQIEIELEERYEDMAPGSVVEVSTDGTAWTAAWQGWTGGLALAGTLEHQLRAPLRFTLPDITARYIRIRPAPPWVADAMKIFGPR